MQAADNIPLAAASRSTLNRRFCIAPMMDCSDRHNRFFLRLFSDNILLYTEMVTATAIVHGDRDRTVPVGDGRRLATLIRKAKLLEVRRVGHSPWALYQAVGRRMRSFLEGGR